MIQFLADPSDEIHVDVVHDCRRFGSSVASQRSPAPGFPPGWGFTHGFVEWIQPRGISKWRLVRAWALQFESWLSCEIFVPLCKGLCSSNLRPVPIPQSMSASPISTGGSGKSHTYYEYTVYIHIRIHMCIIYILICKYARMYCVIYIYICVNMYHTTTFVCT